MVTCAASGCKNTSIKGVKMCYFPKDMNRRQLWIKNANLKNKTVKNSAALCEFHFTSNMWERARVDGTKKLKNTAVPIIFGEMVTQAINKKTTVNQNSAHSNIETSIITSTTGSNDIIITIESLKDSKKQRHQSKHLPTYTDEQTAELSSDKNYIKQNNPTVSKQEGNLDKQIVLYEEKIKTLEKLLQKSESRRTQMKTRHKRLQNAYKNKIKELQKKNTY